MKWISLPLLIFFFSPLISWADAPPTFRQPHPLAWQHQLPGGELPGWSKNWWVNLEIQNANVWNAPLTMTDKRNGKEYSYMADFEQASAYLEVGKALNNQWGLSVEVPYAYRGGGALDGFIDGFHIFINNRRFNRQYYPKYQTIYSVQTDNVEYYEGDAQMNAVENLVLKLKWWPIKWTGGKQKTNGLAFSSRTKFPTADASSRGSTGHIDQSVLMHLAFPIFSASQVGLSAGHTFLGKNPSIDDWPRYDYVTMYEGHLNINITGGLSLLIQLRAESPFLKAQHLKFKDASIGPEIIARNRASSGWNSLVRWRGSNAMGLAYRTSQGNQVQFLMSEDWGIGPYDASDDVYSNGAPDVNFILQSQINF